MGKKHYPQSIKDEKFNCFLSLWAIAASIPDTLPL